MAIKILMGGSPCTHWSIAQKNNRETEPEGMGWELFKNYLIAKEKFKPNFFLYENNKSAAQAIKDQIAKEFGVGIDPDVRFTYINSALVSAQNRQRFYVTNFGDIEQPEDRGIVLRDILESGDDLTSNEKAYCLTARYGGACPWNTVERAQRTMVAEPCIIQKGHGYNKGGVKYDKAPTLTANRSWQDNNHVVEPVPINETTDGKAQCVKSTCYKDGIRNLVGNHHDKRTCVAEQVETLTPFVESKIDPIVGKYGYLPERFNPYNTAEITDKSPCLTTAVGSQTSSSTVMCCEPIRVGCMPSPDGTIKNSQGMRVCSSDGKSVNLTAQGGGLGAKTGLYAVPVNTTISDKSYALTASYYKCAENPFSEFGEEQRRPRVAEPVGYAIPCEWDDNGKPTKAISQTDGKTYTVYEVKDGQITIKGKQYPIKLADGFYIIRKLTVRECARLQTMPDDYCKTVSDSQAYKALGNGWTAEVIIHLLNHALKDVPRDEEIIVLSMYDGIATGRYCLDKMGFTNVTYHAYEIDKYPIQVAMDNYPDIIQHGDAFAVREDDWKPPQSRSEWLDGLLGGGE